MEYKKFNGQRLKEALQFRGIKMSDLSKKIGISRQSLSLYANNDNNPPFENVRKIANTLCFPIDYFMTQDLCTTITNNTYFRSQATARRKEQDAQKIKLEYVAKMSAVLMEYVNFPRLDIPSTLAFSSKIPDPQNINADEMRNEIEDLACYVRKSWGIANGPIEDMQYILASHGIIVTGFNNIDDKIDAFSQKVYISGCGAVFLVALALGKKPNCRLLFDMAHELGHILMHDWDDDNEDLSREEFNNLERQANMFASAFLLPMGSFDVNVTSYATDVEFYRSLKKKWHVSIQAMMYRTRQLGIISANQFSYMMRTISAKGWRIREPGDIPGTLQNTIFQGAVDALFDGGYLSQQELISAFHKAGIYLNQKDMEDLMGLKPGTLNVGPKIIQFKPKIKCNCNE